jgi:hypothetical protein
LKHGWVQWRMKGMQFEWFNYLNERYCTRNDNYWVKIINQLRYKIFHEKYTYKVSQNTWNDTNNNNK